MLFLFFRFGLLGDEDHDRLGADCCRRSRSLLHADHVHDGPVDLQPQAAGQQRAGPRSADGRPHVHRRPGAGELLPVPAATARDEALIVDPGDEADKLLGAIEALGVDARGDPAHPHALRPRRRGRAGRARPPARRSTARSSSATCWPTSCDYVPWAGLRPVRELRGRPPGRPAARRSQLAGFDIDVIFTPGHSPGHVSYSIADEQALFSGDVLFQQSIGRTDLPGRRPRRRCWTRSPALLDTLPGETRVFPGHMGLTTLERERATNPFLQELHRA